MEVKIIIFKLFKIAAFSTILLSRVHGMENEANNKSPFENLSFDKKVEIGELLADNTSNVFGKIYGNKDLNSYGCVSREFNDAQILVSKNIRHVERLNFSDLTAEKVVSLRKYKALELVVNHVDKESIKRIIQIENIDKLIVSISPGNDMYSSSYIDDFLEFVNLPKLKGFMILNLSENLRPVDIMDGLFRKGRDDYQEDILRNGIRIGFGNLEERKDNIHGMYYRYFEGIIVR